MWWKIASIILVAYAIIAGLLVPLKSGVVYVSPENTSSGREQAVVFHGYNSFYTKGDQSKIKVWLQYDSAQAILGKNLKVLNDTMLEATFSFPAALPTKTGSVMLNAIISHPNDGVSLLPDALQVVADTAATTNVIGTWADNPVSNLNVIKDFTFPYRNVIYESIRNTYYHVPMWFALMFLFVASVWNSLRYLNTSNMDFDRKAAAYAEAGLLFGILGLVTGMLWAHYAWGAAWSNDIKQLMTAVALLIYMAYFILRSSFDEPEKGARLAAVYNIFAFASLIPLLYVVPRLFASLHPGATGNPAFGSDDLDNTMRMVFYPAILGFSGIGFWLAELRYRAKRIEDQIIDNG